MAAVCGPLCESLRWRLRTGVRRAVEHGRRRGHLRLDVAVALRPRKARPCRGPEADARAHDGALRRPGRSGRRNHRPRRPAGELADAGILDAGSRERVASRLPDAAAQRPVRRRAARRVARRERGDQQSPPGGVADPDRPRRALHARRPPLLTDRRSECVKTGVSPYLPDRSMGGDAS